MNKRILTAAFLLLCFSLSVPALGSSASPETISASPETASGSASAPVPLIKASEPRSAARPLPQSLQNRTLRLDYIFSGTASTATIALDELLSFEGWYGRSSRLDELPLRGNGQIRMQDSESGKLLYTTSFSTLFQEWQATEEATRSVRSFENVFLVPMPSRKAEITVELYDFRGQVSASLTHTVDPKDILIRSIGCEPMPYSVLHSGSAPNCVDIAIVGEGYSSAEDSLFLRDARATVESLLAHEPFGKMRNYLNIIAVCPPSPESGVSIPGKGIWKRTALSSQFDTFYMERYLTTLHLKDLHDVLAGIPYEHIIILANTDNYGGGGIYNSYTLTTAHHPAFSPVVVHEFGHSFAGLGDEYYYDDMYAPYYHAGVEPWEQYLTTCADFSSKWEDMMNVPGVGLFEGGGYQSKGVWRPAEDCRMKTNGAPGFCPVCQRAIERLIRFYCE